jgi:hypothetical protein
MPRNDTAERRISTLKRARAEDAARKRRSVADAIQKLADNGSRVTFELVARRALLTELIRESPHVNGDVAVSGVTVTACDGRW